MSLILSGSDGVSDIDGSASTPAIRGTDANTGIFFPAADTIAFSEGGVEAARFDSAGNFGLGVTPTNNTLGKTLQNGQAGAWTAESGTNRWWLGSNWYFNSVDKYINNGFATLYSQQNGTHTFFTAASGTADNAISFTQAMTIDVLGNMGLGVTPSNSSSTYKAIQIKGLVGTTILTSDYSSQYATNAYWDGSVWTRGGNDYAPVLYNQFNGAHNFLTAAAAGTTISFTQAMTLDASGNLLVGTTSASGNGERLNVTGSSTSFLGFFDNTSTGNRKNIICTYSGSSPPNDTANEFIFCNDNSTQRMSVRSNGGIANYSANDVNLSDRREKTNFAPATAYLDKICAIPVQTFNYIDQNLEQDDGLTLGVVAQDVQAVAPELVMESNWAKDGDDPKMRLSIYQTDLQYALMKCIQELKAELDTANTRLAALENK